MPVTIAGRNENGIFLLLMSLILECLIKKIMIERDPFFEENN